MAYGGWRPHIEDAVCLDLKWLMEVGAVRRGDMCRGRWIWSKAGQLVARVGYRSDIDVK